MAPNGYRPAPIWETEHVSVPRGRQWETLDDPTNESPPAGMFRGFILRNSDVGAAALTLDLFLFRAVCAKHI